MIIDITEHFRHLWPCPSRAGKQRSHHCHGNGNDAGMWEVGAGAESQFCGPTCVSAPKCVPNTTMKLLLNSPARLGAFQCPRRALPSLILLLVGDFPPQGSSMTFQSPFLLSLGRSCSLSLHSKGIPGCSGVCKEHCCLSTSLLPNSWQELLVELQMLAIAFTLCPQLPAPGFGLWGWSVPLL